MAIHMDKCRTCGKPFEACRDLVAKPSTTFRWQKVACSPECGEAYLKAIRESRGVKSPSTPVGRVISPRASQGDNMEAVAAVSEALREEKSPSALRESILERASKGVKDVEVIENNKDIQNSHKKDSDTAD